METAEQKLRRINYIRDEHRGWWRKNAPVTQLAIHLRGGSTFQPWNAPQLAAPLGPDATRVLDTIFGMREASGQTRK